MSAPRADRADCIGMIGSVMVELLAIATREDLQAAMAFWTSPEAANAWNAIECIRLVDAKLEAQARYEGPCLGPM